MGGRAARGLGALLTAAAVAAAASLPAAPAGRGDRNPVQLENALPGTTVWRAANAQASLIEAYTSEVSAAPGDDVHLHVSTAASARYRVEVLRLGWYGGTGARLITCIPSCTGSRLGLPRVAQLPDPSSGLLRLEWPVTDTIRVGPDWLSGYYYLDVVLVGGALTGARRHVPLIVRAPPDRHALVLAQASVNTWEAYNAWGGESLYTSFGSVAGSHVSFQRPYDLVHQSLVSWELPAVHFLERYGYDVAYTTDVDTDREPDALLDHALVMVLGHDEYWTRAIRDAFDRARDAGVNLAFLGANIGYWQVRYEDDRQTIVEYRDRRLDPEQDEELKTTTFGGLAEPRPECELLGVGYGQVGDSSDFVVTATALADPWFAGAGFTPGSVLHGLVGYEWSGDEPGCNVPALTVLLHHEALNGAPFQEGARSNADAVRYTAASGARVFSAGSLQFSWGLDPLEERYDARLDRFMRNGLDDLTRPPAPRAATSGQWGDGVVVDVTPTDNVQVGGMVVYRRRGPGAFAPGDRGVVRIEVPRCATYYDHPGRGVFRYAVAYESAWRTSAPVLTPAAVRGPPLRRTSPHTNVCLRPLE